jgi:predicted nucleic acid-binding Zn ribbon protein
MRKTNTIKLSEAIREYLEKNQLGHKIKSHNVKKYWEDLMGNIISQKTSNIYLKDKTLFVFLDSSVLRNELTMMRSRLVQMMNEKMGGDYIEKVVLK